MCKAARPAPPENSICRRKTEKSTIATLQAVARTRTGDANEGVRPPGAEVMDGFFWEAQLREGTPPTELEYVASLELVKHVIRAADYERQTRAYLDGRRA